MSYSRRSSKRSIWTLRNVEWPLDPASRPRLVEAANGWIVAVLGDKISNNNTNTSSKQKLIRWNVRRGGLPETLATIEAEIDHLFVDPATASNIFLSCSNGEAYSYAHGKFEKLSSGFGDPSVVPGLPATALVHRGENAPTSSIQSGVSYGSFVTAVAWEQGNNNTTATNNIASNDSLILLGTSLGEIYEYSLGGAKKPTLLHKLDDEIPITGMYWERLRTGMVVTLVVSAKHKPTRFYVFFSPHSSSLRMVLGDEKFSLMELPGSVDSAKLSVCDDSFAILSATGIYYGRIDRSLSMKTLTGSASLICESGILPYEKNILPFSLVVTPHHFVSVAGDEIQFINKVASTVIQRERIDSSSIDLPVLMKDSKRPDQVWLRQGTSIVHISSTQEDRDVWKFTLQKALSEDKMQEELFERARKLCTNPAQKAVVTSVRADYHLSNGQLEVAAKYLAQCPPRLKPFADTAIRLAIHEPTRGDSSSQPLVEYLSSKMRLAKLNDDRMVGTIVGAWLTELLLRDRANKNAGEKDKERSKAMLSQFLTTYVHLMDAKTIIRILTSHDVGADECAVYAASSGDLSTAINAALANQNGKDAALAALQILGTAPFEYAETLYYKHANVLISWAPEEAGEAFLSRYQDGLSPVRLLPFLMHYEKKRNSLQNNVPDRSSETQGTSRRDYFVDNDEFAMKYLSGVVKKGCRHSAIISYLIHLYAGLSDENHLYNFLNELLPSAETVNAVIAKDKRPSTTKSTVNEISSALDMPQALRTVLSTGRHFRSAIRLYMGFGLREEAVQLALKVDPALAREMARGSVDLAERKRLWLMIARNAASEASIGNGKEIVSKVVSVLRESGPDVLSVEDVLPFLPDFAQIDEIKDEICEALTTYSSRIDSLLDEMKKSDKSCERLRDEIFSLRNRQLNVRSDARCALTNKSVLDAGEPFYVFPSGFVYLQSALRKQVFPHLNKRQMTRVEELESLLGGEISEKQRYALQTELDGLIAAECPLTGTLMVSLVDKGFDSDDEAGNDPFYSNMDRVEV